MKIIHLSYSDIRGGAARATYRIHCALRNQNIDSKMLVNKSKLNDSNILRPSNKIEKIFTELRPRITKYLLVKYLKTGNPIIHSPSFLPSSWINYINNSDNDIVHLHWVQGELISIADIAKIKKPIVWTVQDMWIFCGAEHYTEDYRWREGYLDNNRPSHESGFDLNRWTWKRKKKHWKQPIQIVAPSRWLAECITNSKLLSRWPTSIIPNTINTDFWIPIDKKTARQKLNLPIDKKIILFGAIEGEKDPRKGFDLLKKSLEYLKNNLSNSDIELVVFGKSRKKLDSKFSFSSHYMGHIDDDEYLRLLYCSSDLVLIPSKQDNLPNVGLEAHACAIPIVAYNVGGLSDIIEHKNTGYLAKPFIIEDFARGINWVLENNLSLNLGKNARKKAMTIFSEKIISKAYMNIYNQVLKDKTK